MKVTVLMSQTSFTVDQWWTASPETALKALREQLMAAQAVWPDELGGYGIQRCLPAAASRDDLDDGKAVRGRLGGVARAAAMTPEERSEVARKAANARRGNAETQDDLAKSSTQ